VGAAAVPFAPTDIPNIRVWFDANEGAKSFAGNNFTDETRSIQLSGFPSSGDVNPNNVEIPKNTNQINGKNAYSQNLGGGEFGGSVAVNWSGSAWRISVIQNFEEGFSETIYTATGNTAYPWQATWANGTVTPTATIVDILATDNQAVVKWDNRVVAGKPIFQFTLAQQPIYETNIYGKKVLSFDGDSISGPFAASASWDSQHSVYCVATSLNGPNSFNSAFAIQASSNAANRRGALGCTLGGDELAFTNGTQKNSTLSTSTATFAVWSYRFTTSGGSVALGKNKTFESLTGAGSGPMPSNSFMVGSAGGSNTYITTKIGEVIGYSGNHNETTANRIIDYLAAKWGIAL
jgi:hypothetical protein